MTFKSLCVYYIVYYLNLTLNLLFRHLTLENTQSQTEIWELFIHMIIKVPQFDSVFFESSSFQRVPLGLTLIMSVMLLLLL